MTDKCDNPTCNNYFWCGSEFCPQRPATEKEIEEFEDRDYELEAYLGVMQDLHNSELEHNNRLIDDG